MRTTFLLLFVGVAIALVGAHPVDVSSQNGEKSSTSSGVLHRERRTIGILRDLFPNFSKMIDQKIQQLTRIIFRIVGRLVLNGGGGGGGGGGGDSDDDRRISITLPTYPPDLVDEDEEDEDSTDNTEAGSDATTTVSPDGENAVAESQVKEVRVKREAEAAAEEEASSEEQDTDATGDNEVADDNEGESSELEDEEEEEEDPRNKRFLNFNLGVSDGKDAGGSGGGSGNFLFDVIRRSADRAARMAGTVYRVLAGTDDAGLPTYQSARSLVAGSGQSHGEGHAALEEPKEGHYGEGVPGPLTRLFVVANKGVASLIQDLILRLAQTSERIVNFKARLITSII
ncbi:uncharacterized protein LOC106670577 [Cimex lectularius]|uniref:Uncharacterized protein n=1 Tax=Cimex lectularius TaxID=79782 RepID=A0A8I6SNH5_CIMLE|nr:uncharacterized protein LOC106670577 [Cimex lectularius]